MLLLPLSPLPNFCRERFHRLTFPFTSQFSTLLLRSLRMWNLFGSKKPQIKVEQLWGQLLLYFSPHPFRLLIPSFLSHSLPYQGQSQRNPIHCRLSLNSPHSELSRNPITRVRLWIRRVRGTLPRLSSALHSLTGSARNSV